MARLRRALAAQSKPAGLTTWEWERFQEKKVFTRLDRWLDHEPGMRYLEDPRLADCVRDGLYFFHQDRYQLLSYVVMPSHFHWLFRPCDAWCEAFAEIYRDRTPREHIMQSMKGYTAWQCNRIRGTRGPFWQEETFDHWVRNDEELARIVHYIEMNPVRAALVSDPVDWPWSSAHDRRLGRLSSPSAG